MWAKAQGILGVPIMVNLLVDGILERLLELELLWKEVC